MRKEGLTTRRDFLKGSMTATGAAVVLPSLVPASVLGSGDQARRYLYVHSASRLFPANRLFFVEVKDLERPPASLRVEKAEAGAGIEVRVTTDAYAYFVKLTVPVEGSRFSDNYFDLFPGQEKVVRVWNALGLQLVPDDIAVSSLPPMA